MSTRRVIAIAAVIALALTATGFAGGARTERVSVSSSGGQGNAFSFEPAMSANGRYVAFESGASNLVAGDTNGASDVFVRDRKLDTTQRVSVSSNARQGNNKSASPAISARGRYVAFESYASNLVAGDTNRRWDVFVRDRKLHTTSRVSVSSAGHQGNGPSGTPAISADGRYVAFGSYASNLVAGDTNGTEDVFVRDRKRHTTRRVSVSSAGRQGNYRSGRPYPAISADGRYVAFASGASNLVAGDTHASDVFVRDRKHHTTRRVSVSTTGQPGNNRSSAPAISADGRYVAFESVASNLVAGDTHAMDVFVRDRKRHSTRKISFSPTGDGNGPSSTPAISADGHYVAFQSYAYPHYGVFVRHRHHYPDRVDVSSTGEPGNLFRYSDRPPAISADGRYVAFESYASNLVAGDTNDALDVFVRGPLP